MDYYQYLKKQNNIDVIIATDGSAGGAQKGQALAKTRANESIKGLNKLTKPIFLNHPDGRLFDDANIFDSLCDCVEKINPDVVITIVLMTIIQTIGHYLN